MNTLIEKLIRIKNIKNQLSTVIANTGDTNVTNFESYVEKLSAIQNENADLAEFSKRTVAHNYIDETYNNVSVVYNAYPSASGGKTAYTQSGKIYKTHILTADQDFNLWIDLKTIQDGSKIQSKFLTVYDMGYGAFSSGHGTRYKFDSANLPSIAFTSPETPLHIQKGQVIAFSMFGGNENTYEGFDPIKLYTDGEFKYFDVIIGKTYIKYSLQKNQASEVESVNVYVSTEDDKYIRYTFSHVVKDEINADNWHLGIIHLCNENFEPLLQISNAGEIEMAIKLNNRPDYAGGLAHGDEIANQLSFKIDGKDIAIDDIKEITTYTPVNTFTAYQKSSLYDPALNRALSNVNDDALIAMHEKTLTWDRYNLSIDQKVEWQISEKIQDACFPMLTPRKYDVVDGISSVITDAFYTKLSSYDLPHAWDDPKIPSYTLTSDIDDITVYGKQSGFRFNAKCSQKINGENANYRFSMRDNSGNNYNKIYFLIHGDPRAANVVSGDVWESSSIISIKKFV